MGQQDNTFWFNPKNALRKMQISRKNKKLSIFFNFRHPILNSERDGFTLLEILVAIAILGIAITIIIQLFSSNLRAIKASGDYVTASIKAEAKMREILDGTLSEGIYGETTDDGYTMDIAISEVLNERTENLNLKLLQVDLTIRWIEGTKQKSMTLSTLKMLEREF